VSLFNGSIRIVLSDQAKRILDERNDLRNVIAKAFTEKSEFEQKCENDDTGKLINAAGEYKAHQESAARINSNIHLLNGVVMEFHYLEKDAEFDGSPPFREVSNNPNSRHTLSKRTESLEAARSRFYDDMKVLNLNLPKTSCVSQAKSLEVLYYESDK